LKKRNVSPPKPSSQNKSKATITKMQTILTSNDFDFIIAALNDVSLETTERQEAKKEEMYDKIEVKLRGVHHPFSPVVQSLLHLCHRENKNWEMSQPNSTE
jgi:hypothetical protein